MSLQRNWGTSWWVCPQYRRFPIATHLSIHISISWVMHNIEGNHQYMTPLQIILYLNESTQYNLYLSHHIKQLCMFLSGFTPTWSRCSEECYRNVNNPRHGGSHRVTLFTSISIIHVFQTAFCSLSVGRWWIFLMKHASEVNKCYISCTFVLLL